ncbi:MAG: hypothetical protein HLUCCA09_00160 [Rhodobacteraceae bacterium HLUCCA09]|nr:MAG: hypothetical protein HLUCCA09_00160 [Rhodobacteraceae bacterium HLUCCA09]
MAGTVLNEALEDWLKPLALLVASILLSVGTILTQEAGASGTLTVAVFPPWWGEGRSAAAVAEAGAPIAGFGLAGWMVVTVPADAASADALRRGGALLLNSAAARICTG